MGWDGAKAAPLTHVAKVNPLMFTYYLLAYVQLGIRIANF